MNDGNLTILDEMISNLELPDSAYEKANSRYEDIGDWLGRTDSKCNRNDPHIFPQGSFRLGTAIRPLDENEKYDLDLACNLENGITKISHTQLQLKTLVGYEIEQYRIARGIKSPSDEKRRCWRLEYQDDLSFHMDIVPCIPGSSDMKFYLKEAILKAGTSENLADKVSKFAISITDNQHPAYSLISDDWQISNPEGYAKWFESRMKLSSQILSERALLLKAATIDDLPYYKWKTPLQRCIQLLKRHRDQMFKEFPDVKPISAIITTLAAKAYKGESNIASTLQSILLQMDQLINNSIPMIPNPVNPEEDFADKWSMPQYNHLQLHHNFRLWLTQARADFKVLLSSNNASSIMELTKSKFEINLNESRVIQAIGLTSIGQHHSPKIITNEVKPWRGII